MTEEKESENICRCLAETFLEEIDDCVYDDFEEEDDYYPELAFRERLEELDYDDGFQPDYLVLFNNENIHWHDEEFYKVYRLIDRYKTRDMTILEPLGLRVYTNGISGNDASFLLMLDRRVISTSGCPISFKSIVGFARENYQDSLYPKIMKILGDEYY